MTRTTTRRNKRDQILDGDDDEPMDSVSALARGAATSAPWKDDHAVESDGEVSAPPRQALAEPPPSESGMRHPPDQAEAGCNLTRFDVDEKAPSEIEPNPKKRRTPPKVVPRVMEDRTPPNKSATPAQPAERTESPATPSKMADASSSQIEPRSKKPRTPPKVVARSGERASPKKKLAPFDATKTNAPPATPPKTQRVHVATKRSELRMTGNTVRAYVLTDMVSFVQQPGQVTKLWIVVLQSGEHVVLHLEDDAHDRAELFESLAPFAFVELHGVSTKKTPEHNCVFLRASSAERRLYFNTTLKTTSIVELQDIENFDIPPLLQYNEISDATRGDNRYHQTLVFAVTNAATSVHFDRHNRTITRQMEVVFDDGLKMDAIFYGHHAKPQWTFEDRFQVLFVLHAKQEGGRIIVNESSVVSTSPPHWFTGDLEDFDNARTIPAGGVDEMIDLVEVFNDPERGAGFIANLTEKSALVHPKIRIEGDVISVDERMPVLGQGANGPYMAFKIKVPVFVHWSVVLCHNLLTPKQLLSVIIKVSQLAPKEAEVVAFGKQAEELADTSLKVFIGMSDDEREEVVAKIRQSTVRINASAEWYPPTSTYQFKAKKIELL